MQESLFNDEYNIPSIFYLEIQNILLFIHLHLDETDKLYHRNEGTYHSRSYDNEERSIFSSCTTIKGNFFSLVGW